jgi:phospholipase C
VRSLARQLLACTLLAVGCLDNQQQAAPDAPSAMPDAAAGHDANPGDASAGDTGVVDAAADVAGDAAGPDAPPPDTGVGDDDAPFAAMRHACAFAAGAAPQSTFGPSIATVTIPIDTFIIVVQENRSFDHYFSRLPDSGQSDVDVASANVALPDGSGGLAMRFHQSTYCFGDPAHDWTSMHLDWNNGANDGFVVRSNPGGTRVLGYFDATDLPFYYALANAFGIGDRYFASVMAPTGPNRLYLYAGTSGGEIANVAPPAGLPTIFARLSAAGVSWRVYGSETGPVEAVMFPYLPSTSPGAFRSLSDYFTDAAAGTLPQVVFLHAGPDEHPSEDMQQGQQGVAAAFSALARSPQWPRSAFLLTWDENGGFYDHVPPPAACAPDSIAPQRQPNDAPGGFDQFGFRVPLLVASPWSRPHFVSHVEQDHTAILRLLELRFGLGALTARDANANALIEFFDFSRVQFQTAPTLPAATVDPGHGC